MKFSILIPVYNTSPYLADCLDSVLSQSYRNYEVILEDDGSTDNSDSICQYYATRDTRISHTHYQNRGLLATRLHQLSQATGDYILFLDSDDFWEPDLLESIAHKLSVQDTDILIFNNNVVDDKGNVIIINQKKISSERWERKNEEKFKDLLLLFFSSHLLNYSWDKCIRKSLFESISDLGIVPADAYGEDVWMMSEIFVNADTVEYIDSAYYNYRRSQQGKGRNMLPEYLVDMLKVRQQVYNSLVSRNMDVTVICTFLKRCGNDLIWMTNLLRDIVSNRKEYCAWYKKMRDYSILGLAAKQYVRQPGLTVWEKLSYNIRVNLPSLYFSLIKPTKQRHI